MCILLEKHYLKPNLGQTTVRLVKMKSLMRLLKKYQTSTIRYESLIKKISHVCQVLYTEVRYLLSTSASTAAEAI